MRTDTYIKVQMDKTHRIELSLGIPLSKIHCIYVSRNKPHLSPTLKDSLTNLFHFQSSRAVGSIGTNWGSAVGQDDNGLERVRDKRLGQSS